MTDIMIMKYDSCIGNDSSLEHTLEFKHFVVGAIGIERIYEDATLCGSVFANSVLESILFHAFDLDRGTKINEYSCLDSVMTINF